MDKINLETAVAAIMGDTQRLIKDVEEIKRDLQLRYVSTEAIDSVKSRVALLEKLCFGGIGVVLLSVAGALIALVLKK